MQNNPSQKTNSSSATQQNTNRPIIWTQKTRYCFHRIQQLVLILSQFNLLHAFPTKLRYIHFYVGIRPAVYAQPLIMFTNTMFDADISRAILIFYNTILGAVKLQAFHTTQHYS
jgi:hypothetical protein